MIAARIWLAVAIASAIVFAAALLPGAIALAGMLLPQVTQHRLVCLKGSTEALFTDCRTHP